MKYNYFFTYLYMVLVISACTGGNRYNSSGNKNENLADGQLSMASLITNIPEAAIPIRIDSSEIIRLPVVDTLPERLKYLNPNISNRLGLAKISGKGSHTIILISDSMKNRAVLMAYDSVYNFTDSLSVYGTERIINGPGNITQTAVVKPDYRIRTEKRLNGVLIESLTHSLSAKGIFTEIRDGNTPVTAYESFDNRKYYIQSFIWVVKHNGGLEKKDVKEMVYILNNNGHMVQTE